MQSRPVDSDGSVMRPLTRDIMGTNATLFVRFTQLGYHQWPDAPNERRYLAFKHRHNFHVEVQMDAPIDNERSVEFHELIDRSRTVMRDIARRGTMWDYGDMSCETIAHVMALRLVRIYQTAVSVSVSEDGECGAVVGADVDDLPD